MTMVIDEISFLSLYETAIPWYNIMHTLKKYDRILYKTTNRLFEKRMADV